jgi:hypothetical protein
MLPEELGKAFNLSERAIVTASIEAYWCNNSDFVMEELMRA